jgi:Uncharacterized protein conserved in bacteria
MLSLTKKNGMKRLYIILFLCPCLLLVQIFLLLSNRDVSSLLLSSTASSTMIGGGGNTSSSYASTAAETRQGRRGPLSPLASRPSRRKQKVYVLPVSYPKHEQSEHKHFILDGIQRSQKLELTKDPRDTDAVWVVNAGRCPCDTFRKEFRNRIGNVTMLTKTTTRSKYGDESIRTNSSSITSSSIQHALSSSLRRRIPSVFLRGHHDHQDNSGNNASPLIAPWSIIIMDWTDEGVLLEDYRPCLEEIFDTFGDSNKNTFVATRTILRGRYVYSNEAGETRVEYGEPINYSQELSILKHHPERHDSSSPNKSAEGKNKTLVVPLFTGHVQPIRYGIRSDLVNKINSLMKKQEVNEVDIVKKVRNGDAIHFWSIGSGKNWYGKFRSAVSQTMRDFAGVIVPTKWNITTEEIGARKKTGRNSVADEYATALLNYKIVVVAQRDNWEGHYRLMEAMAGGALVLTDPMHPLPRGIEDRSHVIVYNNMTELKDYLKYYLENDEERLAIAKHGYIAAMSNHRSWNIMENVVFGDWSKSYSA